MKTFPVVCAVMLGSVLAGVAQATSPEVETRHKEIHFADLNLNHNAGARTLYQRIRIAARQICGESNPLVTTRLDNARRCADEATARAVAQVNSPLLTKYHVSM
jgi:UrcA family protein